MRISIKDLKKVVVGQATTIEESVQQLAVATANLNLEAERNKKLERDAKKYKDLYQAGRRALEVAQKDSATFKRRVTEMENRRQIKGKIIKRIISFLEGIDYLKNK